MCVSDLSNKMDENVQILLKASFHMVRKARPILYGDEIIGYRVPCREFERVRAKLKAMEGGGE